MIESIKKLFGLGPAADFSALVSHGAQIIDVRSESEYRDGHLKGSLNIPLNMLGKKLSLIKKDRPVITCCASGMRSASASSLLKSKGFEVYNGGGWKTLESRLK